MSRSDERSAGRPDAASISAIRRRNHHTLQPNHRLDFSTINAAVIRVLPAILTRWLPGGRLQRREYVALNPKRADRHLGSFRINVQTGRWADFATGDGGGDPISLAAYLFDLSQVEAARQLAEMVGLRS
jgi:hypothetical protein